MALGHPTAVFREGPTRPGRQSQASVLEFGWFQKEKFDAQKTNVSI